ncbi:MAG TPA: CHAP domain-containing protein [Candidatus Saccharimonadales bacterium]|nr:CHAP domain-containing protein [Candidatus Saccharimonadales bacterium]
MKQKQKKQTTSWRRKSVRPLLVVVALVLLTAAAVPTVRADRFDDEIRQLQQQNATSRSSLDDLKLQATSFQNEVDLLNGQIAQLSAQIAANQAEQAKLQAQIDEAQAELDHQRGVLSADIKAMYVDGDITTLEMLATSRNLSDFVDKEEYRNAVQSKIQETLRRISKLQADLKDKKEDVDTLLKEEQSQQTQLDSDRAEQNRLLTFNQSQQSEYNNQIKSNNAKISELRRQQVLTNLALFGGGITPGIPGGGGYPWGNAYCLHTGQVGGDCYNYDWYFSGSAWDPWGYGFRNCTSWVAYKLASDGKTGFTFMGNANNWPSAAQARGIGVSYGSGARPGDAVVNPKGFYGHIMYAEAVTEDGRVVVSDYNRAGDGLYRGPDGGNPGVLSQSGLVFIHF